MAESDELSKLKTANKINKIALTKLINKVLAKPNSDVSADYLLEVREQAKSKAAEIYSVQKLIYTAITNMASVGQEVIDQELEDIMEKDTEWNDKCNLGLAQLVTKFKELSVVPPSINRIENSVPTASIQLKLPELKIKTFSDNSHDLFEFYRFASSFLNAVNSVPGTSGSVKLVYLKSYLSGRALTLIENYPITDQGFDDAWNLLKQEFLDENLLINETLTTIIKWPSSNSLEENMNFVTFLKSKLNELKKFNLDYISNADAAGQILMGNIVRGKLFSPFLREMMRKVDTSYPSVYQILDYSTEIYKLIKPIEGAKNNSLPVLRPKNKLFPSTFSPNSTDFSQRDSSKEGSDKSAKGCRFCLGLSHSSLHCRRYADFNARQKRVTELNLCAKCMSAKHNEGSCPGKSGKLPYPCKSCLNPEHVTPMCPSMVLSFSAGKQLKTNNNVK